MANFHDLLYDLEQAYNRDVNILTDQFNDNINALTDRYNSLGREHEQLKRDYDRLRHDYDTLKQDYNTLRHNPIYTLLNQLLEQHNTTFNTSVIGSATDSLVVQTVPRNVPVPDPVPVPEPEQLKTPNKPIRPQKEYKPEGSVTKNLEVKYVVPPMRQIVTKQPTPSIPSIPSPQSSPQSSPQITPPSTPPVQLVIKRGRGRPKKVQPNEEIKEETKEESKQEEKVVKHNPKLAQGDFTLGKKLLDNSWLENKTDDFVAGAVANLYNNLTGKTPNTIENRDNAISNFIMGFNHVKHHTNYSYIVQKGKGKGRVKEIEKNQPNVDYVDTTQLVSILGLTLDDDGFVCRSEEHEQ